MYTGSFGTELAFRATVQFAVPMIITSLGVTLAFKMKFWNIGAEGQMIIGAICATYFALYHSGLPQILLWVLMFVAAVVGSGICGIIPALLSFFAIAPSL